MTEAAWEKALSVQPGWLRQLEDSSPDLSVEELGDRKLPLNARLVLSQHEREKLGVRAKERRQHIGLRLSACAEAIGVSTVNLSAYERAIRKFPDVELEKRWETELGVPAGWLRNTSIETPGNTADLNLNRVAGGSMSTESCKTAAAEIRAIGAWLSRKALLRRTTDWSKLSPSETVWAEIFSQRYGVLGEERAKLEAIGTGHKLTRERIRQIVKTMTERAIELNIATPCLDSVAIECQRMAPVSIAAADAKLQNILGESLSVASAQRFGAEILGKKVATINAIGNVRHIATSTWDEGYEDTLKTIRSIAFKMIRYCGAANLHYVSGLGSQVRGEPLSLEFVRTTLSLHQGFEWLIEDDGWFWFGHGNGDNRLQKITLKIMAAAKRKVDIDAIYLALGRASREKYGVEDTSITAIDAPVRVIQKVLSRTPWLDCIHYNDFVANDLNVLEGVLSEVEAEILQVIESHDGVAAKFEIERQVCSKLGVSMVAVNMALSKSGCFIQPARGMYSVCGCDIEPDALGRAINALASLMKRSATPVRDEKGNFIHVFELTEYHVKHKAIAFPTLLAEKVVPGLYVMTNQDSPALVSARESGLTVLSRMMPALDSIGATVGAQIKLIINPVNLLATLELERVG